MNKTKTITIFEITDNWGDTLKVKARQQDLDPGEVVVFINDGAGVLLRADEVKRLRKALKLKRKATK